MNDWLSAAVERICYVQTLPEGWDSYGAARVNTGAAEAMGTFLSAPRWATTQRPAISPTTEGGLIAEWYCGRTTLQVEFGPSGSAEAYTEWEGIEWEGDLAAIPGGLDTWAERVAAGQGCRSGGRSSTGPDSPHA